MRVLVDVVEHHAGGADPVLAQEMAKMTFEDNSSTNQTKSEGITYINRNIMIIIVFSPNERVVWTYSILTTALDLILVVDLIKVMGNSLHREIFAG